MPIHDWTRVPAGLFHEFHQSWSVRIKDALNQGILPKGLYALVEQRVGGPEPDVIAVETGRPKRDRSPSGGAAVAQRPQSRVVQAIESDAVRYSRKANRITVRHQLGEVVAVIEIVSPGNKSGKASLRDFVQKGVAFLRSGIHLLVVDLFPPGPRDPQGIHKAIWDELREEPFELPPHHSRTIAGYDANEPLTAYVETVGLGDALPIGPLFVGPEEHVAVPLELTYQATWAVTPEPIRELVEGTATNSTTG